MALCASPAAATQEPTNTVSTPMPWHAQAPQAAQGDGDGGDMEGGEPLASDGDSGASVRGPGDLCKETAHNLALIYQASGAPQLARELYLKYLTVT